jgi:2-keto-4-pentenoate hydratase/2-oxohepta-3-ene-1,7-dioic acid hydratase in catechol pathway
MIALSPEFPQWPTLREVVEAGALDTLIEAAQGPAGDAPDDGFQWEIPVPAPEKIICVGVNFPDRNAEYKDGQEAPENMSLFVRFPALLHRPRPAADPPGSLRQARLRRRDRRGDRQGRPHIPDEEALDHIAALTLCNEGTLRDWVRHAKFNVTQGKNFDSSGAMGPWLVPFRDPSQIVDVHLTTRVNGEVRQDDRTGRMIFPVARQIAYISTFTTLVPGDIIVTGTPTGAGARFDPPVFLKPGDVVEVEAEGIGMLKNGVADET